MSTAYHPHPKKTKCVTVSNSTLALYFWNDICFFNEWVLNKWMNKWLWLKEDQRWDLHSFRLWPKPPSKATNCSPLEKFKQHVSGRGGTRRWQSSFHVIYDFYRLCECFFILFLILVLFKWYYTAYSRGLNQIWTVNTQNVCCTDQLLQWTSWSRRKGEYLTVKEYSTI